MTARTPRTGISRRGFVTGALGAGVAAGAGAVLAGCSSPEPAAPAAPQPAWVPFEGKHQAGITTLPIPEQGLVASFNLQVNDRAGLKETLQELTDEIRGLMAGKPPETRDPAYPPVDSGILGDKPPADNLSILVGVGASVFDKRFGLADRKPRELETMPFLANDRLDPDRSHGDLLLSVTSTHEDLNLFAELAAVRALAPAVAASRILRSATLDGAEALGFGSHLGSIEPGKRAELIAVRIPPGVEDVEEYLLSGITAADVRWLETS